jgi:predicted DNA-binding protein
MTVAALAGCDTNPSFADAVFFDVRFLGTIETDTNSTRNQLFIVIRTLRIDGQSVGKCFAHLVDLTGPGQDLSDPGLGSSTFLGTPSVTPALPVLVVHNVLRYSVTGRIVMPSPVTLRLDEETKQRIAQIAKRKRQSASEVIREAIQSWMEIQESTASPYDIVADLIGVVHGGKPGRSTDTGRQFTELVRKRRGRS